MCSKIIFLICIIWTDYYFYFQKIIYNGEYMVIIDESKDKLGYTELKQKDVDEYTASEIYVKQVLERIRKAENKILSPYIVLDLK